MAKRRKKRPDDEDTGRIAIEESAPLDGALLVPPPLPERLPLGGRMTLPIKDRQSRPRPDPDVEVVLSPTAALAPDAPVPPPLPDRSAALAEDDLDERVTVPAPRADRPERISVVVHGLPADARVWVDDEEVGAPFELPPSDAVRRLLIRAPGFLDYEGRLIADRDLELTPELLPDAD